MKYFKRLAPNGANGQVLTHSNHLGTHLDGEIHFFTPGKDIASLDMDFLIHEGAIVDLSDVCGDYDVYTSKMIEERVEIKEGDIRVIHTGYHHFGWDHPTADEIRYMVKHPGPDREFAEWAKAKKLRWIAVDCGSADHPMNTINGQAGALEYYGRRLGLPPVVSLAGSFYLFGPAHEDGPDRDSA